MRNHLIAKVLAVLGIALLGLSLMSVTMLAHESRNVAKYTMEVGFFIEPAIEGQMNGISLTVTNTATTKPVTDLEKTLQVAITCVPAQASKTFAIEPVDADGDPGHYNNGFIPTTPGQYSLRVFGTIEGTAVNETFTSGQDTFSDVLSAAPLQFPQQLPQIREVSAAVQGAQNTAQSADTSAQRANTMSIIALVLGAAGLAAGLTAMSRKRS